FQPLPDDDVAGGTGANAAAGVINVHPGRFGHVQHGELPAVVPVPLAFGIDHDRDVGRLEREFILALRPRNFAVKFRVFSRHSLKLRDIAAPVIVGLTPYNVRPISPSANPRPSPADVPA